MITRKLVIAGISALALSPGVAWACTGSAHPGPHGSTGATGATGATGSTGTSAITNASLRSAGSRRAHHAHERKSVERS